MWIAPSLSDDDSIPVPQVKLDDTTKRHWDVHSTRECPQCHGVIPATATECPLCGYVFPDVAADVAAPLSQDQFEMREVENLADDILPDPELEHVLTHRLIEESPFAWAECGEHSLIASGFDAWAGVLFEEGQWYAVGGRRRGTNLLMLGSKPVCLAAASDFMNRHQDANACHKQKPWLSEKPTPRQLEYLPQKYREDRTLTRYQASALLTIQFRRREIRALLRGSDL